MPAEKFLGELEAEIKERPDVVWEKRGEIQYDKVYDFARIISQDIKPEDSILFIRSGIHGEEIAGPLTMRRHLNEVIDYAHDSGLKVIIYPLANPSGFESGERYNIANELGDEGTDDIIRYQLRDGSVVSELAEGQAFQRWFFSNSPKVRANLPQEAALMLKELKDLPVKQIKAMMDLHQDYITPDAPSGAYHYSHSDIIGSEDYRPIVAEIEKLLPVLKNVEISAGYETPAKSNKYGFITRHDGSLADAFYRMGVEHSIVVETMGATPLETADGVNMLWIKGVVDMIKKGR